MPPKRSTPSTPKMKKKKRVGGDNDDDVGREHLFTPPSKSGGKLLANGREKQKQSLKSMDNFDVPAVNSDGQDSLLSSSLVQTPPPSVKRLQSSVSTDYNNHKQANTQNNVIESDYSDDTLHIKSPSIAAANRSRLRTPDNKSASTLLVVPSTPVKAKRSPLKAIRIPQKELQDALQILRKFDIDYTYGPNVGLSRKERWSRAQRLGMYPDERIKSLIQQYDNDMFMEEDRVKIREPLWYGEL
ncbi:hypothetical protein MP228_007606 [Amoeboaphelidium protococcarum]|nr:hypothetical protein MP228_007606 [Amoeboaphelidium protococcarum]